MTDTATLLADSAVQIGALDGYEARAELLIALAHQCRDRGTWGGDRALTYWDRLPDKIRTGTYAGPTLAAWWQRMTRVLGCTQPRDPQDRADLAAALSAGGDQQVLTVMRGHTEALCLRVRLAHQYARDNRTEQATTTEPIDLETS